MKHCSYLLILKDVITALFTYSILYAFLQNFKMFGLREMEVHLILIAITAISLISSDRYLRDFVKSNLELYQASAPSECIFFENTILAPCMATLLFQLPVLLPLVFCSTFWSIQAGAYVLLTIGIGSLFRLYGWIGYLQNGIPSKWSKITSLMKFLFTMMLVCTAIYLAFQILGSMLYIVKILLTSAEYQEEQLYREFLASCISALNEVKKIGFQVLPFLVCYFAIGLGISMIHRVIRLQDLYLSRPCVSNLLKEQQIHKKITNQKALPFVKILYRLQLATILQQLRKQPEWMVWMVIELLLLLRMESTYSKFICILWFCFIGCANELRSFVLLGREAFSNDRQSLDLYYWRLSGHSPIELYQEKLQVVMQYSEQMMFLQLCVSAIFTVVFLRNPILGVVVALILVMWKKIVHPILCHLVRFSSFMILAKACESSVQIAQLSESIDLEDRLQNILRMPFVMLPMFTLIGEYVYGFLNLYLCIGIVGILFLYAIGIRKWMFHLIRQASERLEKVHIPD